jgi:MFS transporter, PAT family, beta-lactamase induction signal transducer AmpG
MSTGFSASIFSRRMMVALGMGITSGLPLLLTGSTLQAWLREKGADLSTVGAISLIGLPYTLKFLWSPLFDRFRLPFLGRRRGWLIITQLLAALAIFGMGQIGGNAELSLTAMFGAAVILAFFSASQDIVVDAYRRESLADEELGLGSSLYISGYRIALLISGAGSLALAEYMSWQNVFAVMAAIMASAALLTLWSEEPPEPESTPHSFREAVVDPFVDFFRRNGAWLFLAFIFLYKVGDQMASNMSMPLYIDHGYSKLEIGAIAKGVGFWATILGGLIGGVLIIRLGTVRALLVFGVLQMVSTAGFTWLNMVEKNNYVLAAVIGFENLTGGMGTAAYAAFMASLTNRRYTATQYALLSSFMGIPRVIAAAPTGWLAEKMGYSSFFMFCTLIAIPGLLMVPKISRKFSDGANRGDGTDLASHIKEKSGEQLGSHSQRGMQEQRV